MVFSPRLRFLILFLSLLSPLSQAAQRGFEGTIEYVQIDEYHSEKDRQELLRKIEAVNQSLDLRHQIRMFSQDTSRIIFQVKEDSLIGKSFIGGESMPHQVQFQQGFRAQLFNPITGKKTKIGMDRKEEEWEEFLDENLHAHWRDRVKVGSWFKKDYDQLIRHPSEEKEILGYRCTLFELPAGRSTTFYWIAESLRPGPKQDIPYFFQEIFTPHGMILRTEYETNRYLKRRIRQVSKLSMEKIESMRTQFQFYEVKGEEQAPRTPLDDNQHLSESEIGDAPLLPDFYFRYLGEERLGKLSDFQEDGKHLLIALWASWCRPCLNKIPELKKIQRRNKAFLQTLSLNTSDLKTRYIREVVQENEMDWPQGLTTERLSQFLNPDGRLPRYILLDPEGRIRASGSNLEELEITKKIRRY